MEEVEREAFVGNHKCQDAAFQLCFKGLMLLLRRLVHGNAPGAIILLEQPSPRLSHGTV